MGSVTRRFKRNLIAATLAGKVGARMPPAIGRLKQPTPVQNAEKTSARMITWRKLHSKYVSPLHYRSLMLRITRHMRDRLKAQHVEEQKVAGRRKRLDAFFGTKSWLRRMIEKIFPSLVNDVKREAKMERLKLRQQRTCNEPRPTFERKGR